MKSRQVLIAAILAVFVFVLSACSHLPDSAQAAPSTAASNDVAGGDRGGAPPFSTRENKSHHDSVTDRITIPRGTPILVRLQNSVSSATANSGQHFDAVLAKPLVVNGRTVAERGTPAVGRVVSVRRSGRLHHPGYIRLALASVRVNGKQVPVETSSISAQGKSHKKRNVGLIGGGAGAGALIGALAGGGKGALIGSAIGAGAGTTTAYATGKKDVAFSAERTLTFRLMRQVTAN